MGAMCNQKDKMESYQQKNINANDTRKKLMR